MSAAINDYTSSSLKRENSCVGVHETAKGKKKKRQVESGCIRKSSPVRCVLTLAGRGGRRGQMEVCRRRKKTRSKHAGALSVPKNCVVLMILQISLWG